MRRTDVSYTQAPAVNTLRAIKHPLNKTSNKVRLKTVSKNMSSPHVSSFCSKQELLYECSFKEILKVISFKTSIWFKESLCLYIINIVKLQYSVFYLSLEILTDNSEVVWRYTVDVCSSKAKLRARSFLIKQEL